MSALWSFSGEFRSGKILAGSIVGPRSRMVVAKKPPFFILSSVKDRLTLCFSVGRGKKKRWCGLAAKLMFCKQTHNHRPDGYTHIYKSSEGASLWKNPLPRPSSRCAKTREMPHILIPLFLLFFFFPRLRGLAGASYSRMSDNGTAKTGKQLPPGIKPHRSYVCICVCM
jgi:hypothetical protein